MEPAAALARILDAGPRPACSAGEWRAACWARDELRRDGREARMEIEWVRPQWAAARALCAALAAGGTLLSVASPAAGLAVCGAALLALAGELTGLARVARLPFALRATQNVVSPPREPRDGATLLVITANLDAPRAAAAALPRWQRVALAVRVPWGILVALLALLALLAGLRVDGETGQSVAIAQFALALLPIVTVALLADAALAAPSPGANANASGAAVALALALEIGARRLHALDVELVLSGAGAGEALGFERYVRRRRRERDPQRVVVLAIERCGAGAPRWLERDGQLVPLRFHPRAVAAMASAAACERQLAAAPLRPHGASAGWAARRLGWPGITVTARDEQGLAGNAGLEDDTPQAIDPEALHATLELCLAWIAELDTQLEPA